ncbi:MAG: LegC family aminotransferase [Bacteroidales bacterium]|jgi:aminotransferase in exopolysaccharide biosynthesis|nr:LegC family aminotransferase [Bacteroidales bacterium]
MYKEIVDFIRELYNNEDFVPLHSPVFMGKEKEYLTECIDTTYVSSVGKFVDRFEKMIEEYTGTAKAVVCVNGTNALHLALILSGVERDDEIITQSLTFVATCNAISYTGAYPVFLDIDTDTLGLSPVAMKNWLINNAEIKDNVCYNKNTGRCIKACVPMHTFGHPVHLDELLDVCNEYHLDLIEDSAESLGSFYKGKHTGTFGKIGILSFNGNKTITTGGGGMLLFNDISTGQHAKHLTTQAKLPHKWEFIHDTVGYNYRMPNINAALGCAQMENIELYLNNKRDTAEKYKDYFSRFSDIDFFAEPENCKSNYWLNSIIMSDKKARNGFLQYTNDNNIMTRPAWQLMNKLPMFDKCQRDDLKNTYWFEERIVNIPSSVRL